jgi:hypothetical protein
MNSNKIINEDTIDEKEIYWQTQAILVMNNLNLNEKSNNIYPVKYLINGTKIINCKINNLELMENLSI